MPVRAKITPMKHALAPNMPNNKFHKPKLIIFIISTQSCTIKASCLVNDTSNLFQDRRIATISKSKPTIAILSKNVILNLFQDRKIQHNQAQAQIGTTAMHLLQIQRSIFSEYPSILLIFIHSIVIS